MNFNLPLYFKLMYHSFFRARRTPCKLSGARLKFLLTSGLVGYPLLEAVHRLGFAVDEVFHRRFRHIEVREPVFIIAPNRSGTTLLVNTLAQDQRFTAPRMWEYFFAPAISERKAIWGIGAIGAKLGIPFPKILANIEQSFASNPANQMYYKAHRLTFNGIEEDNLYLLHNCSVYDLASMFPFRELIFDYADYDRKIPQKRKQKDMLFLKRMVQRHLAAHPGKRYLSKMTTLSSAIPSVLATFPDAKIIHLVRHPVKVVPSSVKLWMGHWLRNGCTGNLKELVPMILEHNKIWYERLHQDTAHLPPEQYIRISYNDLVRDIEATVSKIYEQFGIPITEEVRAGLKEAKEKQKKFRSENKYSLEEVGLSMEQLAEAFAEIAPAYGFTFPPAEPAL